MISYLIIAISFVIDGILTNFLPYSVMDLSLFTPLTTIVALIVVYPFFYHQEKKYLITSLITGLLYDLFYTNLLFLNAILFLCLAFIYIKLYKLLGDGIFKILFHITLLIIIYELLTVGIILIFNLVPITSSRVIYKISHSLLLNLIYGEALYLIRKIIPKKYYKVHIN